MNYIKMLKHIYQLEGKKVEWGLIEEITYTKEKNIWGRLSENYSHVG